MDASPPRLGGVARVWILNAGLAAAFAALFGAFVVGSPAPDAPLRLPWWALALAFFVVELAVVHIQLRRDAHSFSLSEVPLVVGLLFAAPAELVTAQVAGAAAALVLVRRQVPLKLVFNLALLGVGACLAVIVFRSIASLGDPIGPAGWAGAFAATTLVAVVGTAAIVVAISLTEGWSYARSFPKVLAFAAAVSAANTSLGLLAGSVIWFRPEAAWMLLVPSAVLYGAYRAYTRQRQRHESLEFLYASARTLQRPGPLDSVVRSLLTETRDMFRAEVAEITYFATDDGEEARRSALGPGEAFVLNELVTLDPTAGVWARIASEGEPILLPRPIPNGRLRDYFAARGVRDAMVVPLQGPDGVVGKFLVGNRLGDVSTFDEEDLRLFETLATNASVSLEKERLVARLEESLAHLTEMNRMKDDFVATVSHELRTPLTSIQGCIDTVLRHGPRMDAETRDSLLDAAGRQSRRLRHLIEDLLAVSRVETHQLQPELSLVALTDLLEEVADDFRTVTDGRQIGVRGPTLPDVRTDGEKVRQILANLVENAIKYSPEGTAVGIEGRQEGDGILLSVSDAGFGIPPDQRDRIFERFYQVDQSTTRSVGGTGLGLYICRRLAAAIGGRLWLERSGPKGSVFCLWIPRTPPGPAGPGSVGAPPAREEVPPGQ